MSYRRPPGSTRSDFDGARETEELVGSWLGEFKVGNLTATDRLDWWVPGVFIDVKEKNQKLTKRWTKHTDPLGWEEPDVFVLDELSVRRAIAHFPQAYFLVKDNPGGGRWFLMRIDEVCCTERVRLNRNTSPGNFKGKWLIHLPQFRLLTDPEHQLMPTVLHDQTETPWKASHCLSGLPVMEV